MGRAERRKLERRERIEERKNKVLLSQEQLNNIREGVSRDRGSFDIETMLTCFALTNHRLYGHDTYEVLNALGYIDAMMNDVLTDKKTIDDLRKEAEDEVSVTIKC